MTRLAVEAHDLSKAFVVRRPLLDTLRRPFGGVAVQALEGIGCEVAEGEFFGLLGENGAGKTTFFRILSTLVSPDRGRALILGADVAREAHRVRSLVAPVFTSDRSLYWRLSARENLRLFASLQRLPPRQARDRIAELLKLVGLDDTAARLVGTFSAGMKQRLLLARALLARPRVLLLDEPTRSLDPIAARSFRTFLREDIGHTQGCTVLLATHDPDDVRDLCDRVGVLHRGRLLAVGTSTELGAGLRFQRYRLVAHQLDAPAVAILRRDGTRVGEITPTEEPAWLSCDVELPPGAGPAAESLSRLAEAGVRVARFERVEPPLAELIERVAGLRETGRG